MKMKLLRGPNRRRHDVAISIRGNAEPHVIRDIVEEHGCPPHVTARVISALAASGRYDCAIVACAVPNLIDYAAERGISVIVTEPSWKIRLTARVRSSRKT